MDAFAASTPARAAAIFASRRPNSIFGFGDASILQLFLLLIVDYGGLSGAHGRLGLLDLGAEIVVSQRDEKIALPSLPDNPRLATVATRPATFVLNGVRSACRYASSVSCTARPEAQAFQFVVMRTTIPTASRRMMAGTSQCLRREPEDSAGAGGGVSFESGIRAKGQEPK